MRRIVLVLFAFFSVASIAAPAAALPSSIQVHRLLTNPEMANRAYMGEHFDSLLAVRSFYEGREYEAVWTRDRLEQLRLGFIAAQRAGLDPDDYHFAALSREYDFDNEMAVELLATDAALGLIASMVGDGMMAQDATIFLERALADEALAERLQMLRAFRAGR